MNWYANSRVFMRRSLLASGAVVGAWLLLSGLWIPAKALLAQHLIASAWADSQQRGEMIKPWRWADTWPVARLQMPAQAVDLYVMEGDHGQALAFGPGRIAVANNSAVNTNGQDVSTIIAGHRDTHFQFLQHVRIGEALTLTNPQGDSLRYRITSLDIENSGSQQLQVASSDHLLLVTCYPFDAIDANGPLRYVVRAQRESVSTLAQNQGDRPNKRLVL